MTIPYDKIGATYSATRRPDPRIAARILADGLGNGARAKRHSDLLNLEEIDLGYRLIVFDHECSPACERS